MALTGIILLAEALGGYLTNSLALLSDAGHMLTDVLALALSYFALSFAQRPPTSQKTYGFHRVEILAALANGVTLILISLAIFYEAYQRIAHPPEVKTTGMLIIAAIGLGANLISALLLRHGAHNLNIKGALLHVLGDALSSMGIILGGLVMLTTGWYWVDPAISIGIGTIIIIGAYRLVRDSVDILLEATPRHIDLNAVVEAMRGIDGVRDVHDVHIWCITPQICLMSSHLLVDDTNARYSGEILSRINRMLADRFGIAHTTFQLECEHCSAGSGVLCDINGVRSALRNEAR